MPKRIMVILRGLPGSGKSSFALKLFQRFNKGKKRVVLCSADNFFMKRVVGPLVKVGPLVARESGPPSYEYQFDPSKLGQAHQKCWQDAFEACSARVPLVIIDNTNSEKWEYANYECLAKAYGYSVTIQEVGIFGVDGVIKNIVDKERLQIWFERQTHDVPLPAFLAMWWRWEVDQQARPLTDNDTDPNLPDSPMMGLTVEELDGEG